MALVNKLGTIKLVNPEGDRILLRDSTGTYGETIYKESTTTEGEYVSEANTTGYGAPNLTRDQVVLFVVGKLKKVAGDVDVAFEGYDWFTATEFKAIVTEDGWYRFNLIGIPIITDSTTLTLGDAGYLSGEIYYNQSGIVEVVEAEDLVGTKYCSANVDQLFLANCSLKKHEIIEYLNILYKGDQVINRPKIQRAEQQHRIIRSHITGSIYEYCRGNQFNAQTNVEYLNKYIIDIRYGI